MQIIDATPEKVSPVHYKIELYGLREIRREMSRVYRDMRSGKLSPQNGTRFIYALREISRVLVEELDRSPKPDDAVSMPRLHISFIDPVDKMSDEDLQSQLNELNAELSRRRALLTYEVKHD